MASGDPVVEAYYRLAIRLFLTARNGARRGNLTDRLWLMSPAGAGIMESLGLDVSAVRAVLVLEWCRRGLGRVLARPIDKVSRV